MARSDTPGPALRTLHQYRFSANNQQMVGTGHNMTMDPLTRYVIDRTSYLGRGRYSRVWSATDRYTHSVVAIKFMARRGPDYVEQEEFQRELKMLTRLTRLAPSSVARFCDLKDWFATPDGYCLVFERYSATLSSVLSDETIPSLPTHQIKEISRQLIQGTRYLHDNGIIHTDLNPANIMFISAAKSRQKYYGMDNTFHERNTLKSSEIRIIDFGSVNEESNACKGQAGTPGYQAPEVVLGRDWTETIDHFAIGCIIAEMLTGKALIPQFTGHAQDTIAIMEKVLGPFPAPLRVQMETQVPGAFACDTCTDRSGNRGIYRFLQTAKTLNEKIEDPEGVKLIKRLTDLDPARRGPLRIHERSRFIAIYEM
ncbi:kinase-like domain-containing protein [Mycena vulgaris]|nr:kinase-like domain-containing protein [Mycena vulgaris]